MHDQSHDKNNIMADSAGSGVPESSKDERLKSVIEPSTIKAFVAGIVIGNLSKNLLLGFTVGAVGGIFIQQNFAGVPDVRNFWRDLLNRWNKTNKGSNS